MNQLVQDVIELDNLHQAVFRVALAQNVQPILMSSKDYSYAVSAINLSWRWIEHHDVTSDTLYEAYCNDDDFGVAPAMEVACEQDRGTGKTLGNVSNAWGCLAEAIAYAAYCAFTVEGEPIPDDVRNDLPDEQLSAFLGCYDAVMGRSGVPEQLAGWLKDLPEDQLTQAVVGAKMAGFVSSAK
jgi:hypothetical protein